MAARSKIRSSRLGPIFPTLQYWVRLLWGLNLVAVVWGSLLPEAKLQVWETRFPLFVWNDKLLHSFGYLGLAFLAMLSFSRRGTRIAVSMILVGALLEVAQISVSGRSADWKDALANTAGVLAGIAAGARLREFLRRQTSIRLEDSGPGLHLPRRRIHFPSFRIR